MKPISVEKGIERVNAIRTRLRESVARFEANALKCSECQTPGACCIDEHFVNVRVSPLEGEAIRRAVEGFTPETRTRVLERAERALKRLDAGEGETYSCPLFEKGAGCLVHDPAKPLPCITHACYERLSDLPPDDILDDAELAVERVNIAVYGRSRPQATIPEEILKRSPLLT